MEYCHISSEQPEVQGEKDISNRAEFDSSMAYATTLHHLLEDQEGPVTNYQYVEIPASTLTAKGAGNYTVKIILNSSQAENIFVRCSLAWAQK